MRGSISREETACLRWVNARYTLSLSPTFPIYTPSFFLLLCVFIVCLALAGFDFGTFEPSEVVKGGSDWVRRPHYLEGAFLGKPFSDLFFFFLFSFLKLS